MKNFIIAALVLILLGIGGYYYYTNYYLQDDSNDESTSVYNTDDSVVAYAGAAVDESETAELKEYDTSYFDLESIIEEVNPLNGHYGLNGARNNFQSSDIENITKYCLKENTINNEKFTDFIVETKNKFYQLVSSRTYRISNIDNIINGLLMSYSDLNANQDLSDKNLKSIYKLMNNEVIDATNFYNDIEKYIRPESLETYENIRLANGSQFTNGDLVWFYSFWARRNHEGNTEQTLAILQEVNDHYNPETEISEE